MGNDIDTLAAARTLFGVNADLLDVLTDLRERAESGEISIGDWRARDQQMRAGMPIVDDAELRDARRAVARMYVDEAEPDGRWSRLQKRLHSLLAPPTDEELRQ